MCIITWKYILRDLNVIWVFNKYFFTQLTYCVIFLFKNKNKYKKRKCYLVFLFRAKEIRKLKFFFTYENTTRHFLKFSTWKYIFRIRISKFCLFLSEIYENFVKEWKSLFWDTQTIVTYYNNLTGCSKY